MNSKSVIWGDIFLITGFSEVPSAWMKIKSENVSNISCIKIKCRSGLNFVKNDLNLLGTPKQPLIPVIAKTAGYK